MSKQITVSKAANKSAPKQAAAPAAPKLAYCLKDGMRPASGALLQAHTEAFFQLTGMVNGKRVPTSLAQTVMGKSAISWHTKRGNLDITSEGVGLSEVGEFKFGVRNVNQEFLAGYVEVFTKGVTNASVGVKADYAIQKLG